MCVCVRCLVLCYDLCKGHMFDRLLDLDSRCLRVADTDQNLPTAYLCLCRLMGGTGQRGLMRDRLTVI